MSYQRILALLPVWVGLASQSVVATDTTLTQEEIFARASPSVVTIHTFDARDRSLAQGSGVVTGAEEVATNCHVIRDATRIQVNHGEQRLTGRWSLMDRTRDLCLLSVPELGAPMVALRALDSVAVGEPVVAVGNPLGFGLAASRGLIVTIQAKQGETTLVTSAPVSPGSSGGGLFDLKGQLIGFTSAILGTGQNLNLVIPATALTKLRSDKQPPLPPPSTPAPEPRWLETIDQLWSKGDWQGVESHARQWTQAQPTSAFAHAALAAALTETKQYAEAANSVETALKLDPYLAVGWSRKAVILHAQGKLQEAEAALQRAAALIPGDAHPHDIRTKWLIHDKRYAEAREEARQALRLATGTPHRWSTLGMIEDALGHHEAAAQAYRVALRQNQHDADTQHRLAQSLAKLGRTEAAKATLGQRSAAQAEADTWVTIGGAELVRERLGPAQDAYRKAIALAPEHPLAWNGLGVALMRMNRTTDAEQAFDRAVSLNPGNAEALANRASARSALGHPGAIADAKRAVTLAPQDAFPWRVYGLVHFQANKHQEAITGYSKLDELKQASADDLTSLGESLAATGRVPDALAALRRAEQGAPKLVRPLITMAKVLGNAGDITAALDYLTRAIDIEPSNAVAWSSKGYALIRLGRLGEAVQVLETAVRLAPDSANAWINLGNAQLNSGNLGRAIEALEKAIALNPNAMDGHLYLAQSYLNARQPNKARTHSAIVVARLPDQPAGLAILTMAYLIEGDAQHALAHYARLRTIHPGTAKAVKAQAVSARLALATRLPD